MKTKTPKRIMALLVAIIMLIVSAQSTLAITNDSMYSAEFEPGSVIVSLKSGAPSVTSLLNGFSIEESRLIIDEDRVANARRVDEQVYNQQPQQTQSDSNNGMNPTELLGQLFANPEMGKAFQAFLQQYNC